MQFLRKDFWANKKFNLTEKRLVYLVQADKNSLSEKEQLENKKIHQEISDILQKASNEKALTPAERFKLRKHSDENFFSASEKEKIRELIDTENTKAIDIIREKKTFGKLLDIDKEIIASSLSLSEAISILQNEPEVLLRCLKYITAIASSGKPASVGIDLIKSLKLEITKSFIDENKAYLEKNEKIKYVWINLAEILGIKIKDQIAEEAVREYRDESTVPKKVQEIVEIKKPEESLLEKRKDSIAIIQKVFGKEKADQMRYLLQKEENQAKFEQKIVSFIQSETEKRRMQVLENFRVGAAEELERSFDLIYSLVDISFTSNLKKEELLKTLDNQKRAIQGQLKIVAQTHGDRKKLINAMSERFIVDEKTGDEKKVDWLEGKSEPAMIVLNFNDKLKERVNELRQKAQMAGVNLWKFYEENFQDTEQLPTEKEVDGFIDENSLNPLLKSENVNQSKDLHTEDSEQVLDKKQKRERLREKIKEGNHKKMEVFFKEIEDISEEFGILESDVASLVQDENKTIFQITDITQVEKLEDANAQDNKNKKTFLKNAFLNHFKNQGHSEDEALKLTEQTIKLFQQKKSFLQDFFKWEYEPLEVSMTRGIFQELSKLEEVALTAYATPKEEVVLDSVNNAEVKTQSVNNQLPSFQNKIKERIAVLQNFVNDSQLDLDARNVAKVEIEKLRSFLGDFSGPISTHNQNETLQALQEGEPILRSDLSQQSEQISSSAEEFKNSIDQWDEDTSNLSQIAVSQNSQEKAEKLREQARIANLRKLDFDDLQSPTSNAIQDYEKKKIDKISESFMRLRNLLLNLRNVNFSISEEELKSYKNWDGSEIFKIVEDEKMPKGAHGQIDEKNGKFTIQLKRSEFESGNLRTLKHELAHAIDFYADINGSKNLIKTIKSFSQFTDWQKTFELWKSKNNDKNADFGEEMFARILAEDFEGELGNLALEILGELKQRNIDPETFLPEDAVLKKGLKKFFKNSALKAADTIDDSAEKAEKRKRLYAQFLMKKEILEQRLKEIEKSSVEGAKEWADDSKQSLEKYEDLFKNSDDFDYMQVVVDKRKDNSDAVMDKWITNANKILRDINELEEEQPGYFSNLWENTTFLSLADLKNGWNTFSEYVKRRHQRNSKLRMGKAGSAIFEGINKNLAAEYDLQKESAEKEEVNKIKESLSNKDAWQVYERLKEARNNQAGRDLVKACMYQLAEWGRIDWRRQDLWDAFHRIGAPVRFRDTDRNDMTILRAKFQKAVGALWDNDTYRGWERQNISSYDSKMQEYAKEVDTMSGDDYPIELAKMLTAWRKAGKNKDDAKVDPMRYEEIIDWCIPHGQMVAEDTLYYLIQGVAEGILSPERPMNINNKYLNDFPASDYFNSHRPTLQEYKKWAAMTRTDDGSVPKNFKSWMNTHFMTDKRIVQRTIKSVHQGKWDHDFMQMTGGIGDTTSARTFCSKTDNGPLYPATAYPNAINGQLMHMTDVANNSSEMSEDRLREWLARQSGYIAMSDAILYGRLTDRRWHKMTNSDKDKPNRIAGYWDGAKKPLKTKEMSQKLRKIVTTVEPDFFGKLFKLETDDNKGLKELQAMLSDRKYAHILTDENGKPDIEIPKTFEGMYELAEPFVRKQLDPKKNPKAKELLDKVIQVTRSIYEEDHGAITEDKKWDWSKNFNDYEQE